MATLCGIHLKSCLLNATGVFDSTNEQIQILDQIDDCRAVISKSYTILKKRWKLYAKIVY